MNNQMDNNAMKIGFLKETGDTEARVALTPHSAQRLKKLGYSCFIEKRAGEKAGFADEVYADEGVSLAQDAKSVCKEVDIIVKVQPPSEQEINLMRKGQSLICFFYPAQNENLMKKACAKGINVIAMDMVPRVSRAQKMDALSSMANIAGYRSVVEAAQHFGRFFTGQVTAAGKIQPAKILIIGAGVAGLAAIGTAQSMGAIVYAFDVRPEVAEQIESMGAQFLFLDFDDKQDSQETGGYAAPSSPEFREKQLALFREYAPMLDIVITTALIPGQAAPKLWLKDMVDVMKSGSVIVDLAAEKGGNCELTQPGKHITTNNGVKIVGYTDLPSRMSAQSSELYAMNVYHMMDDLTPNKDGQIVHNMTDDVIRGATITYEKEVTFPPPKIAISVVSANASTQSQKKQGEKKQTLQTTQRKAGFQQVMWLALGAIVMGVIGLYAPASFMQHFTVFVLAVFVGFQVINNVSHALHTPLMAVTNAISGIIILGALVQSMSSIPLVEILVAISVFIATINIVGGFIVTRKMLQMFQKS